MPRAAVTALGVLDEEAALPPERPEPDEEGARVQVQGRVRLVGVLLRLQEIRELQLAALLQPEDRLVPLRI